MLKIYEDISEIILAIEDLNGRKLTILGTTPFIEIKKGMYVDATTLHHSNYKACYYMCPNLEVNI